MQIKLLCFATEILETNLEAKTQVYLTGDHHRGNFETEI